MKILKFIEKTYLGFLGIAGLITLFWINKQMEVATPFNIVFAAVFVSAIFYSIMRLSE